MIHQNSRTARVMGPEALEILAQKHVAIFGVGGVGGYVAEALARSGVGTIEIIDNDEDGDACGTIIQIVYKGDHYQVIIRTDEEEEDFVVDTEYTWNENDRVSVKIPKDKIKLKLKAVTK